MVKINQNILSAGLKSQKILPSLKDLELVRGKIKNIPNKKGEYKRQIHYGCYLLCSESGLRVSEAVKFDLRGKTRKGLYRINRTKGKKERFVYVSKKVIKELKSQNWQPNQTNRHNFYHFLRKIKQETNINPKTELTPHNLRRAFATYQAENGMPLPVLQKLLGHSSIRTTALYWKDIYSDDDDPSDILAGKKWLENREKELPQPPAEITTPSTENLPEQLPENLKPVIRDKPVISAIKPTQWDNSLLTAETEPKPAITNHQPKSLTSEILPIPPGKFISKKIEISEQLPLITNRKQSISQKQNLLAKIKQLEKQLKQIQDENEKLRTENKHLKALVQQDQETETKILQPLLLKGKQ